MGEDDLIQDGAAFSDRTLCDKTLREVRALSTRHKTGQLSSDDFAKAVAALMMQFEPQTDLGARLREVLNKQRG